MIYSLKKAAELSGYSIQHLRRLCKSGKVAHVKRGGAVARKNTYYYFTEDQIKALFVEVPGENMQPRGPQPPPVVDTTKTTGVEAAPPVTGIDTSKTEFPL